MVVVVPDLVEAFTAYYPSFLRVAARSCWFEIPLLVWDLHGEEIQYSIVCSWIVGTIPPSELLVSGSTVR